MRHITYMNGCVVDYFDHRFFQVIKRLDITQSPHQVLHVVELDGAGPHFHIALAHRPEQVGHIDAVGFHRLGIGIHLVFPDKTADRRYFRDSPGRGEPVAHVEILYAAQLLKVPAPGRVAFLVAALQGIPENLSEAGGIGAQRRLDPFGQGAGRQRVEFFKNSGSAPVEIDILFENHIDTGHADDGIAANRFYTRHT